MSDRLVYAGTDAGLYELRSGDARALGLRDCGMLAFSIVVDPAAPDRLFAATYRSGVWRSDDRGASWREINEGLLYKEAWSLSRDAGGRLYCGCGPTSIFRSDDGVAWRDLESLRRLESSREWTMYQPPFLAHVKGVSPCPLDTSLILAAVEVGWVLRSQDAGETWANIQDVWKDCHSITWLPGSSTRLVLTTGQGVFTSDDAGLTFAQSDGVDRTYMAQAAVHADHPEFLLTAGAEGARFTLDRPEGSDSHVFRSRDGGRTWEVCGGGLPVPLRPASRAVAADPGDPSTFLVGLTDGSIWITEDSGDSFVEYARLEGGWIRSMTVVRR